MKIVNYIFKKILYPACFFYSAITIMFLLFTEIAAEYDKPALYLKSCAVFFLLSMLISLSNKIFSIKKMSVLTKVALHALSIVSSIVLVSYINTQGKGANPLVLVLLFTVVYAIVGIPILLVWSVRSRKNKENKDYKSMFGEE